MAKGRGRRKFMKIARAAAPIATAAGLFKLLLSQEKNRHGGVHHIHIEDVDDVSDYPNQISYEPGFYQVDDDEPTVGRILMSSDGFLSDEPYLTDDEDDNTGWNDNPYYDANGGYDDY